MGKKGMSEGSPAFYARTGETRIWDFFALLHPPYTAWNLSYVVIGAAMAPELNWLRLSITLAAFFAGTGIASHALDELNDRPLKTGFSDFQLKLLGLCGLVLAFGVTLIACWIVTPWVLVPASVGFTLVAAYTLEWWGGLIHNDLGFALSWGAFPVLVGYWVQTESMSPAALAVSVAATMLSLAQRALSAKARFLRRRTLEASVVLKTDKGDLSWSQVELLSTWEWPLKLLSWTVVLLALGLLAMRVWSPGLELP